MRVCMDLTGRISVFGEAKAETRAQGLKGGVWAFASHEEADHNAVLSAAHEHADKGEHNA